MKVRLCDELEAAWTTIQNQLSAGATPNYIYKTGDIEVVIEPFDCALRFYRFGG